MTSFTIRFLVASLLSLYAVPVLAQTPGVDEEGCRESALMSRYPGCGIFECVKKEFDV
jgi:hypothetical protein